MISEWPRVLWLNGMLKIPNKANIGVKTIIRDFNGLKPEKTVMPFAVVSASRRG